MLIYIITAVLLVFLYILFRFRKEQPAPSPVVTDTAKLELHRALLELGQSRAEFRSVSNENSQLVIKVAKLQEAFDRIQHQKKSSEVKTGHISEQLVVLAAEFPVPIDTLKFFGAPIDFISIDLESEMISFIEVKSGAAVLSDKQKLIKRIIDCGNVQFLEVRINEKGISVK